VVELDLLVTDLDFGGDGNVRPLALLGRSSLLTEKLPDLVAEGILLGRSLLDRSEGDGSLVGRGLLDESLLDRSEGDSSLIGWSEGDRSLVGQGLPNESLLGGLGLVQVDRENVLRARLVAWELIGLYGISNVIDGTGVMLDTLCSKALE
jgi:hypothetical protein